MRRSIHSGGVTGIESDTQPRRYLAGGARGHTIVAMGALAPKTLASCGPLAQSRGLCRIR